MIESPFSFAIGSSGARHAAVLPSPVGACAMKCVRVVAALCRSSMNFFWTGLIDSKGNSGNSILFLTFVALILVSVLDDKIRRTEMFKYRFQYRRCII